MFAIGFSWSVFAVSLSTLFTSSRTWARYLRRTSYQSATSLIDQTLATVERLLFLISWRVNTNFLQEVDVLFCFVLILKEKLEWHLQDFQLVSIIISCHVSCQAERCHPVICIYHPCPLFLVIRNWLYTFFFLAYIVLAHCQLQERIRSHPASSLYKHVYAHI